MALKSKRTTPLRPTAASSRSTSVSLSLLCNHTVCKTVLPSSPSASRATSSFPTPAQFQSTSFSSGSFAFSRAICPARFAAMSATQG